MRDLGAFLSAHPLESVLAAYGVNVLGIVALVSFVRWLERRRGGSK